MFKELYKEIRNKRFNKKYNTKIKSISANLDASYGRSVLIARGTTVLSDVKIGDFSYVNNNSYIENCEIGKFCSISSGVYINPTEHRNEIVTTHPFFRIDKTERKKVIIGNDVLISLNVIILEGVVIGDGAIVGAGAIVTKNVEAYEIVGGIPARHIRYRFSKEKREYLLKTKWWDWKEEYLRCNKEMFNFNVAKESTENLKKIINNE